MCGFGQFVVLFIVRVVEGRGVVDGDVFPVWGSAVLILDGYLNRAGSLKKKANLGCLCRERADGRQTARNESIRIR